MNIAVIFAGGTGTRTGIFEKPKQFLEINRKPVIVHTIEHFQSAPEIDTVVVACLPGWIDTLWGYVRQYSLSKVKRIVPGGTTGQESIYNALLSAKELADDDKTIVLIHDAVRPLIMQEVISENIRCVEVYGNAITCGIVQETPVRVDGTGDICNVEARSAVRVARAPQSFWLRDILEVHEKARAAGRNDYVDSCTMMHQMGKTLHYIDGNKDNIKITTFEDFYVFRAYLHAKEDRANFRGESIDA